MSLVCAYILKRILFKNSDIKTTLLFLVNIIVNTECQHSQHNFAGHVYVLLILFLFFKRHLSPTDI